jgi:DNA-binding response OmpR family regulator
MNKLTARRSGVLKLSRVWQAYCIDLRLMRILLIDDDEVLMEGLADKLIEDRYAVDIATNGEMGWEFICLFNYDLVLLDWMLPDVEGIEICQRIRAKGYEMPIMLLTARDRHIDKVRGLDAGADDYVVKPFNFEELTARIRALLRREIHVASPILQWQGLNLDPKTHQVTYQQQLLPLTPKEHGILELFLRHPQQVFSPGAIIDNLWAGEDPPGEEAVRTHIKGLRHKLKTSGMAKDTIETVYGVGYRLKSFQETPSDFSQKAKSDHSAKLKRAWEKFRTVTQERLAVLRNLSEALTEERVEKTLITEAQSSAHKLAGSLGGFGFPQGSTLARQIENLLVSNLTAPENIPRVREAIASLEENLLQHQSFQNNLPSNLGFNISLLVIEPDVSGSQHRRDSNYRSRADFLQQLAIEARTSGINLINASQLDRAKEIIHRQHPTAVLLSILFPDGEELDFLEQLHQERPLIPIVVIIQEAGLLDRLEIVRRGGNSILQDTVSATETIAAVNQLLEKTGKNAKIMIVDDDSQILLSLEIALLPWGFQVTTLEEPQQFWNVLETVNPDLLVLDIEMPGINGIELCQLLRCDRRWQHLPVLFLTVHQDRKIQDRAFAIGADDYICKPVVGSELANRIINRLQRSRISGN